MERIKQKVFDDIDSDIDVKVTATKNKTDNSCVNVYAMLVDKSGNKLLKWSTRRTVKVPEDIDSAMKELDMAMRWAATDAAARVPRTTAPVAGARRSLKAPGEIDKVIKI